MTTELEPSPRERAQRLIAASAVAVGGILYWDGLVARALGWLLGQ